MAEPSTEHAHPWKEPCTLACPAHSTPEPLATGSAVQALAKKWHDVRWTYWREAGEELQDAIDADNQANQAGRAGMAEILAQHVLKVRRNDGCFCTCGGFSVGRGEGATDAHAAHQAEALRGAAHPYTRGGYSGGGPASSVNNPAKVPSAAKPWSDPDSDPVGDIIENYGIRGLLRVNGIRDPKAIAVNGEVVYQADPDAQGDSSTPGAEHDAPTSQPASGSRDRFFDEVIDKYGDSFKLRKDPNEKVVFPVVDVDDSQRPGGPE